MWVPLTQACKRIAAPTADCWMERSQFFSKKAIKKGNCAFLFSELLLKLPIKWSYSILVQSEADLLNLELRIVYRAVDLWQGLCWCWVSDAVYWAARQWPLHETNFTPHQFTCVARGAVFSLHLTMCRVIILGQQFSWQ